MENPEDDEYDVTIQWLGDEYDPEHFDPDEVHFDDPEERFKESFDL